MTDIILEKLNYMNDKIDDLIKNDDVIKEELHKFDKRIDRLEEAQQRQEDTDTYLRKNIDKINEYILEEQVKKRVQVDLWKFVSNNKIIISIIILAITVLSKVDINELLNLLTK